MPSKRTRNPQSSLPPFGALSTVPFQAGGPRNRRILGVFWTLLPFLVVMLIAGIIGLGLQFWSWQAMRQTEADEWQAAQQNYQRQSALTSWGPAPWVARYNLGTALLHLGQIDQGIDQLELAFEKVPRAIPEEDGTLQTFSYECQVRINLAVGWEGRADQQKEEQQLEEAIVSYDQALEWVTPCQLSGSDSSEGEGGEGGEGGGSGGEQSEQEDEAASTGERIQDKKDQTERELSGEPEPDPGEDPSGQQGSGGEQGPEPQEDPFAGETPEERERREQLEQRNEEQREAEREKNESESGRSSSRGW